MQLEVYSIVYFSARTKCREHSILTHRHIANKINEKKTINVYACVRFVSEHSKLTKSHRLPAFRQFTQTQASHK